MTIRKISGNRHQGYVWLVVVASRLVARGEAPTFAEALIATEIAVQAATTTPQLGLDSQP